MITPSFYSNVPNEPFKHRSVSHVSCAKKFLAGRIDRALEISSYTDPASPSRSWVGALSSVYFRPVGQKKKGVNSAKRL